MTQPDLYPVALPPGYVATCEHVPTECWGATEADAIIALSRECRPCAGKLLMMSVDMLQRTMRGAA